MTVLLKLEYYYVSGCSILSTILIGWKDMQSVGVAEEDAKDENGSSAVATHKGTNLKKEDKKNKVTAEHM